jgi:hypothetical protein
MIWNQTQRLVLGTVTAEIPRERREGRGGGLVGGVFSALLPNDSDDKKCETGCSSNIGRPCQRRVSQMSVDYLHSLRIPENLPK